MFRKIYLEMALRYLRAGKIGWLARRALQYALISLGAWVHRPLCGPILGTLSVGYACNCACPMCNFPSRARDRRSAGRRVLGTADFMRVLREFHDLGTAGIGFTGGEPLLHPDILELLDCSKKLGMLTHLNTNGLPVTPELARDLVGIGVDSVNISLDGPTAEIHDRMRGHPGAFAGAMRALSLLDAARRAASVPVRLVIATVIGPDTVRLAPAMTGLARDHGVDAVFFIPQHDFNREAARTQSFHQDLQTTLETLLRQKEAGITIDNSPRFLRLFERFFRGKPWPLPCHADLASLGVDEFGDIFPCMPWLNYDHPVGSVWAGSLTKFWYSAEYRRHRREEVTPCRDCYLTCQAELNLLFHPLRKVPFQGRPCPACHGAERATP